MSGGNQETVASLEYNSQHRPVEYVAASGDSSTYEYNADGQLARYTNALSESTRYEYSTSGDLETVINANGATATGFTYDSYARVRTITDSEGWTVTYAHDAADRLVSVSYPDGSSDRLAYDKLDLASYTDRLGKRWTYSYDANRRLTQVVNPDGSHLSFGYAAGGQVASLVDPSGIETDWEYDVQGRPIKQRYANGGEQQYYYEGFSSRLSAVLDALGQIKRYTYADDDRLTRISYDQAVVATPSVSLAYDAYYPRLISMTDGTGTTAYSYVPVKHRVHCYSRGKTCHSQASPSHTPMKSSGD